MTVRLSAFDKLSCLPTSHACQQKFSKQNHQAAISKRNSVSFPDRGRIIMTRNYLICPFFACPYVPANIAHVNASCLCLPALASAFIGENFLHVYFSPKRRFKVARGYFLGTEVLFSKSSFGHVNLDRFL